MFHLPDVTNQTNLMVIQSFHAGSSFDHPWVYPGSISSTWRKSLPTYFWWAWMDFGWMNFAMDLRCPKRSSTIWNIEKLRWYMFSKFQCESGKLPPSKSTLREKIFRSHYTSLVWKSGHLPSPVLPDPKEFGRRWNSSQKSYESIMAKNSFHFWVHYWTMNMKMQDRLYQP